MQLYKIKKWDNTCYVTPFQFIEYERKWRVIIKKVESRPRKWSDSNIKKENDE